MKRKQVQRFLACGDYPLSGPPHRQFVFALPKGLRVFFRHGKRLHGEIGRLICALVRDFAAQAAGTPLRMAAVVVFQTAGAFCPRCGGPPWGWNAHWHGLFLGGGTHTACRAGCHRFLSPRRENTIALIP